MRKPIVSILSLTVIASVTWCPTATAAAVPDDPAWGADEEQPLWEPPGEPEGKPEPPPPPPPDKEERLRRLGEQRPPQPPDAREPRFPQGVRAARGQLYPGHLGLMERLLPLIAERHPDLAERLRQIRHRSPEEFERLLADALAVRLGETLDRRERGPFADRPRAPQARPPEHRRREPDDPRERELHEQNMALEREMVELHRENEELERRSMELAHRYRELRERRDPAAEAERDELRHQIEETIERHFDVRTELRRIELRRIEMQLDHLRGVLDRVREDLERREHARGPIIERRREQLLQEGAGDW